MLDLLHKSLISIWLKYEFDSLKKILARLHAQNWIFKWFSLPICAQFFCKAFVFCAKLRSETLKRRLPYLATADLLFRKEHSFVLGGNENNSISFWDFLTFTNKNWFGCLLIKNLGVDSFVLCKMTHFTIPRIHSLTERFNPLITFLAFITQQPCQINKLQNSAAYFFFLVQPYQFFIHLF